MPRATCDEEGLPAGPFVSARERRAGPSRPARPRPSRPAKTGPTRSTNSGAGWTGSTIGRILSAAAAGLLLTVFLPQGAEAQLQSRAHTATRELPRVFLDCQTRRHCDNDHFRTEIRFVNWVRDRTDADVHVIFTSTGLGGDGMQYSFDFVGRGTAAGIDDQLTYLSAGTDVAAEVVDGLTQTLRLGLIRYAVQTGLGRDLEVALANGDLAGGEVGEGGNDNGGAAAFDDPWNYWTFRFGLSGNVDLRETRRNSRINPSLNANRVTADWKLQFSLWANLRTDRRQLQDGTWLSNDVNSWRVGTLVARSVSDHVSFGFDGAAFNSVQRNQRARLRAAPAVEYNYYPYDQANRRQMIAHYQLGLEFSDYYEETMYETLRETLPQHRVGIQYRQREEWGNAGVGIESSQYLHDVELYSFGFSGDISYRITRGLEINLSAGAEFTNDNIHAPIGDIDDEDILLGRRSLPSSYGYEASIGFNYRWGSSFANVVNNRFPGSVR
jgi:hypothetical protein